MKGIILAGPRRATDCGEYPLSIVERPEPGA